MTTARTQPDLHRLAEERSLAFHSVVAERLRGKPALLESIRARLRAQLEAGGRSAGYLQRWLQLCEGPLDELLTVLTDPSEDSRALRQCSPFAGLIDPRTRWQIWREVRERLEREP